MANDLEEDVLAMLDGVDIQTSANTYGLTANKDYHELVRYRNVTSYSQLLDLHSCPRRFHLKKHYAGQVSLDDNIDFLFGHAVGAGVQSLWTGVSLDRALFNSAMAWNGPFDLSIPKKKKSIWAAAIAVEKFLPIMQESMEDWELMWVDVDGTKKPGIEIAFSLDCNNGYKHYGHIDVILRNRINGEVAVIELKTTGMKYAEEAVYANSSQALGYSVILDTLFPGLSSYEVFHFIYSSTDREWTAMPFTKTISHKAEWLKDTLLDHAMLDTYHRMGFYPKRGESCYDYFRRCEFFGTCNLVPDKQLEELPEGADAETVDYHLNLRDIIAAQQARM